ncbi:MAG: helix-turn-helix transcriptional regulator [Planctomycetes bacterium]|nr:helix-turn-helix transcriptional regulator [Planctomycetota bacterium]
MPFCHLALRGQKPRSAAYPREVHTLGHRIRKTRSEPGLRQKDVAARLGVDPTTIYNWERNRSQPAVRFLFLVRGFLGDPLEATGTTLAERLRSFRRTAGWSQERLAAALGLDESTVNGWERGRHRPRRRCQKRVESVLCGLGQDRGNMAS